MYGKACGCKKLCPFSLGLAVGITCFFAVLFWTFWVVNYGPTTMMVQFHVPVPTLKDGTILSLWALLKGFLFGFFIALFYDFFSCLKRCGKKSDNTCGCGCGCSACGTTNQNRVETSNTEPRR